MRGDPNFSVSKLPSAARTHYENLWYVIRNPRSTLDPRDWAASDDLYTYARDLHTHVQTLLLAFRATGDLRLLDEIDAITAIMRSKLHDSWRGTADGSSQRDGYVNWVWRGSDSGSLAGKDTHEMDEAKTHALIASVAYALHVNRDLSSPGGRNYASSANFWSDYLVNTFEAKWRARKGVSSGFPIMERPDYHSHHSWTKWHYYMGLLTGRSSYMTEANRMADMIWNREIKTTSTSYGTANVWSHGVISLGSKQDYLQPNMYSRYVFADSVEFYFEDFHRWGSDSEMKRFANTIAAFIIDRSGAESSTDWFTADIGGDRARAGIPSDPSWNRMHIHRWESSPFSILAPWDASGRIMDITDQVVDKLGSRPRGVDVATAYLLESLMDVR